jgi:dipeptidase D
MNGAGGHSASEIHLNRVNTIVEVFNILKTVSSKSNFQIIDVKTSSQLNAIPNYCEVIVNIDQHHVNQLKRMILTQFNNLYTAYSESDKHLSLVINAVKADKEPLILNDSNKLINLVTAANNSLNNFDVNFQTTTVSTNLGKLVTSNDEIQLSWLQRSNTEYDLDKLNNKLISLFTILNGSYKIINIAKGLKADLNNRLALQIQKLISTKFNRNVSLLNTHSVLEIGDIVRHYPTITAVSIGPNIEYPHTPRERVEIKSILYIYDLMKEIVKTIR